jgi:ferredoxin--NADP+ reductase/benzoate/toluate 1,2-dioxygenase reductase subunit
VSIVPHLSERRTRFGVESIRDVSDSAYVVRFARNHVAFEPGQYVSVGIAGEIHMREYSIYSSAEDPFLEILVKRVENGYLSMRLDRLADGADLAVDGPFGFFTVDEDWREHRYYLIATGTGISPFRCITRSYPGIDYRLYHGIRYSSERYEYDSYERDRITCCTTRDDGGDFRGRVTEYLRGSEIDASGRYYLCGNCDMIYEAFDILQSAGVPHANLFAEVYF